MFSAIRQREPKVSIRLLWPFIRVVGSYADELAIIRKGGLTPAEFANPETRIPDRLAYELLDFSIDKTGDPALGLHAGERVEAGDFDIIAHLGRCAATMREGIAFESRFIRLLDESAETTLVENGDVGEWRFTRKGGFAQPAGINEFFLMANLTMVRLIAGVHIRPIEVHMRHDVATDAAEYERAFGCPVRLGQAHNSMFFSRALLDSRVPHADPDLCAAFELHAQQLLTRLASAGSVTEAVKKLAISDLRGGQLSMAATARHLHMSVATLRRRLKEEGTTFRQILDEVRFELAKRYLNERRLGVGEIADLLGFSHIAAFHKAFKRWSGAVPGDRSRSGAGDARNPNQDS